jgi:hypothetical protein
MSGNLKYKQKNKLAFKIWKRIRRVTDLDVLSKSMVKISNQLIVENDCWEKLCGIINGREKPMVDIDYREKLCEYKRTDLHHHLYHYLVIFSINLHEILLLIHVNSRVYQMDGQKASSVKPITLQKRK